MLESPPATLPDLTPLERLGAFFTSQIHDLNNQVAVLSNARLLLPRDEPVSPEVARFIDGLFSSIERLSATCEQFNAARKKYPLAIDPIGLPEAGEIIAHAVNGYPGWEMQGEVEGESRVWVNASWLRLIVSELIAHQQSAHGVVALSVGAPPPRQYKHSLRASFDDRPASALLVHFKGAGVANEAGPGSKDFSIALELIRLLGAAISLGRSDDARDYLLALRLEE